MLFTYRAINKEGKIVKKDIEVDDRPTLLKYLQAKGYFILNIKKHSKNSIMDSLFNRISYDDIVSFTRQIAIMLNAGLTLIESLEILKKQTRKIQMIKLISDIDNEVKSGNSFSFALKKHPKYFSNLYIALVKSGEVSGKLSEIMLRLADNLEKSRNFRNKIKSAMMYPMIVITAMIAVMFIMMSFVVPKLLDLYKNFKMSLPITTQILILISNISSKFWPIILGGSIGSYVLFKRFMCTKKGKYTFDKFVLGIPVFNKVVVMSSLVDATRTLSILISSGISILQALSIVIETTDNLVFQDAFRRIYKEVERGVSLGKSMEDEEIFPPILVQMTMVGEQTGHLDETMRRISQYFQAESELAIKAATALIEPTILLILGLGVGFLVFSIITPIYNLTSAF